MRASGCPGFAAIDYAGNLLSETFLGSMAYDADNHQTTFTDPVTSAVTTYAYNGAGNRVRKITPAGTTVYVYNAFGNLSAEYPSVAPPGPTGTQYRTTDHLGSTRLVTDAAGLEVEGDADCREASRHPDGTGGVGFVCWFWGRMAENGGFWLAGEIWVCSVRWALAEP